MAEGKDMSAEQSLDRRTFFGTLFKKAGATVAGRATVPVAEGEDAKSPSIIGDPNKKPEDQPQDPGRRTLLKYTGFGIVGLVALGAGGALARTLGWLGKQPSEASEATPKATGEPTPTPKLEAQKPKISIMINGQLTPAEVLPAKTIQDMQKEAEAQGKFKLTLPDALQDKENFSLVEIQKNNGQKMFAITAEKEGTYELPVLSGGEVVTAAVGKLANFATFVVTGPNNRIWVYGFPSPGASSAQEKHNVVTGQPAVTVTYRPGPGKDWFQTYLDSNYKNAPKNTIVIIGVFDGAGNGLDASREDFLNTPQGSAVLVGSGN